MKTKKFNAIVLKSINYKDSDKIYTLLTPTEGLISASARGVRKLKSKRSGNLDTANLVSISCHESKSGFYEINEVSTVKSFLKIKNSFSKTNELYFAFKLILKHAHDITESRAFFSLLRDFLMILDKVPENSGLARAYFEFTFLDLNGYAFSLERCSKCEKIVTSGKFNMNDASIYCESCLDFGIILDENELSSLTRLRARVLPTTLSESSKNKIYNLITSYFEMAFS